MDWLAKYDKYKDDKEICDYVKDVQKLRYLYQTNQYAEMQRRIGDLTRKYPTEAAVWNAVNTAAPLTYEQMFRNADAFLMVIGQKILEKRVMRS